jgi:hypothetical protein
MSILSSGNVGKDTGEDVSIVSNNDFGIGILSMGGFELERWMHFAHAGIIGIIALRENGNRAMTNTEQL